MTTSGYQEKGAILKGVQVLNEMRSIVAQKGKELVRKAAALYVYQTHNTTLTFDRENGESVPVTIYLSADIVECDVLSIKLNEEGGFENFHCVDDYGEEYDADFIDISIDCPTLAEIIVNKLE